MSDLYVSSTLENLLHRTDRAMSGLPAGREAWTQWVDTRRAFVQASRHARAWERGQTVAMTAPQSHWPALRASLAHLRASMIRLEALLALTLQNSRGHKHPAPLAPRVAAAWDALIGAEIRVSDFTREVERTAQDPWQPLYAWIAADVLDEETEDVPAHRREPEALEPARADA